MKILYLKHNNIDFDKWEKCLKTSQFPMIYASTEFLNIVAPNWDAIIINDYESVMPIPHRKKHGFSYIFRPVLTQQLGLFGKFENRVEIITKCIDLLKSKYKLIDFSLNSLNLNHTNNINTGITHYLSLSDLYENLAKNFSTNHKRNIAKAEKAGLNIIEKNDIEYLKTFIENTPNEWTNKLNTSYLQEIINAIEKLTQKGLTKVYAVNNKENFPIAICVFAYYENHISYLFGISNAEGKEKAAMFFIFNKIIELNSNSEKTLDFEGSEIENIARFFKGFGSIEAKYPKIFLNNLPSIIKFLKNKKEL